MVLKLYRTNLIILESEILLEGGFSCDNSSIKLPQLCVSAVYFGYKIRVMQKYDRFVFTTDNNFFSYTFIGFLSADFSSGM